MSKEIQISGTLERSQKTNGLYFKSSELLEHLIASKKGNIINQMLLKNHTWAKIGRRNTKLKGKLKKSRFKLNADNIGKRLDVVAFINATTKQVSKITVWGHDNDVIYAN